MLIREIQRNPTAQEIATYVVGVFQCIHEIIPYNPFMIWVLIKSNTKQRGFLWPHPGVPVAFISCIVDECGSSSVLPSFILLLHGREIPIGINII